MESRQNISIVMKKIHRIVFSLPTINIDRSQTLKKKKKTEYDFMSLILLYSILFLLKSFNKMKLF